MKMESNISRDHIALEAMKICYSNTLEVEQTLWNKIQVLFGGKTKKTVRHENPSIVASLAYKYADAMIAEREKSEENSE